MAEHRNPALTVDVIVERSGGILLVRRRFPPPGWAIPGGFVDYGEPPWQAAIRELREETGLDVELVDLFHAYGDPARDSRLHTVTLVYVGRAEGEPRAGDDAGEARFFALDELPEPLAFDHATVIADFRRWRASGARPPVRR